jgi:hypothetical protein
MLLLPARVGRSGRRRCDEVASTGLSKIFVRPDDKRAEAEWTTRLAVELGNCQGMLMEGAA